MLFCSLRLLFCSWEARPLQRKSTMSNGATWCHCQQPPSRALRGSANLAACRDGLHSESMVEGALLLEVPSFLSSLNSPAQPGSRQRDIHRRSLFGDSVSSSWNAMCVLEYSYNREKNIQIHMHLETQCHREKPPMFTMHILFLSDVSNAQLVVK